MVEWATFSIFDAFALRLPQPVKGRSAVFLCAHLLGDYELCRPYIRLCFEKWRKEDLRVVLVCNTAWQELVESDLSPDIIIGIDLRKITHDPRYRISTMRNLRGLNACLAICGADPRDGLIHDACMKALAAPQSFGYRDEYSDRVAVDCWIARRSYSNIVHCPPGLHRTQRHAMLIESAGVLLSSSFEPPSKGGGAHVASPAAPYIVISPSASRKQKVWPAERFVQLARRALLKYPAISCVLVGAPAESQWIGEISAAIGERALSLAGQNSLKQLRTCISGAVAVVGNDSAAIHIAAACGVPSVVVMNGATYGQCVPYPSSVQSQAFPVLPVMAVVPMSCFCCDWNCRFSISEDQPLPCLAAVSVEQVWECLDSILSKDLVD